MDAKEIIRRVKNPSEQDQALIEKALIFAEQAHQGQTRASGDPYIIHPYQTAIILAEFQADAETIAAGLLHDVIEETAIPLAEIEKIFGPQIAFMVEGVTKLGRLKYRGGKRHSESLRKLFVAMAEDIRIIMIRLADRLHNVRTLKFLPPKNKNGSRLRHWKFTRPWPTGLASGS